MPAGRVRRRDPDHTRGAGWHASCRIQRWVRGSVIGPGTFEALEIVALGILGKKSLWDAPKMVGATDARLSGLDLARLAERARTQHARVEERRLEMARKVFG